MPINVNAVRKNLADKLDMNLINSVIDQIDKKLTNNRWMDHNRCGLPGSGYHWCFIYIGVVNESEKKYLTDEYCKAGWRCEVSNSGGTEGCDIIGIKLTMPPEGTVNRGLDISM